MANKQDYVDLGLSCANICKALERGMGGKKLDDVSESVCDAINQLTMWVEPATDIPYSSTHHRLNRRTVAEIREEVLKRSGRHGVSRFFHSRDDKDAIVVWKSDLNRILHIFNVCPTRCRFVAADLCPSRPNLSSTLIQSSLIYVRTYQKFVRTLAARIGRYVTHILFTILQSILTTA